MGVYRSPCVIRSVSVGSGDRVKHTVWVNVDHDDGGSQGFGGVVLSEQTTDVFVNMLRAAFGLGAWYHPIEKGLDDLVGLRAVALFSFGGGGWGGEAMEGLESMSGQRFTLTGFRKKAHPDLALSPLVERRNRISDEMKSMARGLVDRLGTLLDLDTTFRDWERDDSQEGGRKP